MSTELTLADYIRLRGDLRCATAWGFSPITVGAWRRGERIPSPESARVILAEAAGVLSWNSIYGDPLQRATD